MKKKHGPGDNDNVDINVDSFSVFYNNPLPPPPSPLAPPNGATLTLPITIKWTDVPNPQPSGYDLEIARDSSFSSIEELVSQLNEPQRTVLSLTAGTKYWIAVLGPLGNGTMQFRDTLGAHMPPVTLPAPAVTAQFGSPLIPAATVRNLPLTFTFGCGTSLPGTLTVTLNSRDANGRTGSAQITAPVH